MCHASRNCDVAVKIASQFLLWRRSAICCLNTGELDTRTGDRKFHFFLSEVLREDFVCLRDFEISSGVKNLTTKGQIALKASAVARISPNENIYISFV